MGGKKTKTTTHLRALSDKLVIEVQEARSRCFSLGQNLLRLLQVLWGRGTLSVLGPSGFPGGRFYHLPVSDLGAAVQTEQFNVPTVLRESPIKTQQVV